MVKIVLAYRCMMNFDQYSEVKPHLQKRIIWQLINKTLFRLLVGPFLKNARVLLLKTFGADVEWGVMIYGRYMGSMEP